MEASWNTGACLGDPGDYRLQPSLKRWPRVSKTVRGAKRYKLNRYHCRCEKMYLTIQNGLELPYQVQDRSYYVFMVLKFNETQWYPMVPCELPLGKLSQIVLSSKVYIQNLHFHASRIVFFWFVSQDWSKANFQYAMRPRKKDLSTKTARTIRGRYVRPQERHV